MNLSVARTTQPTKPSLAAPALDFHRFSVDDYHRMIDAGILTEDDKVELLDGWIIDKMPQKPSHSSTVHRTGDTLDAVLPEGWFVRSQFPVTLSGSEPEPDIAVVRGKNVDYEDRHPGSDDLGLLIEVSLESLVTDRGPKALLYARAKIAEYWIINLRASVVEVYSKPRTGRSPKYSQTKVYEKGDEVPLVLDGDLIANIPVKDLLR